MSVKISLEGINASGNAKVLKNATLHTRDAEVTLRNLTVDGNAEILQDFDINDFRDIVTSNEVLSRMSAKEYASIQPILMQKDKGRTAFLKGLAQHLLTFSEGVAANVVATLLTK